MKGKRTIFILIMVMIFPLLLSAQNIGGKTSILKTFQGLSKPVGFLDALFSSSKFSMSQSYSVSFGSYGGQSFNSGLYLNTMNFQLSKPLFMQVRMGYAHQPFNIAGDRPNKGQFFLQKAMLQYKPSENTQITIEYQSIPAGMFSPYSMRR